MSKIGVGVYGFGDDSLAALVKMQPGLILMCEPPQQFYNAVRTALPRASIIYRPFLTEQEQEQMLTTPLESALKFADRLTAKADQMPGLWAIQTFNEAACDDLSIARYDRFQYKLYEYWQGFIPQRGRYRPRLVMQNFGVGNPQVAAAGGDRSVDPFTTMRSITQTQGPAINYPIGLHLYSAPSELIDGPSHAWFATRYRFFVADMYPAGGVPKVLPFVATESGTNAAWRGQYSPEEYFRQLKWLQGQLDHDGVLGQCVFGLFGRAGDQAQWAGFDLLNVDNPSDTKIIDLIAEYNARA